MKKNNMREKEEKKRNLGKKERKKNYRT